jgi:hypothetical protein
MGMRSALELTNFEEDEPTRLIFVLREPNDTCEVKPLKVAGHSTDG